MNYCPSCGCCQEHESLEKQHPSWTFCPFCGHKVLTPEKERLWQKRMDEIRAENDAKFADVDYQI